VRRLLSKSAGALDGNGATLNSALGELAQLLPWLADQDDELLALASEVGVLADVIRARDTEVGQLLRDFALVSDALAQERQSIARFLGSLTSLTLQGEALLSTYETSLPEDMDTLASVALTVRANAGAVRQLVLSLREFQVGTIDAYDPATGSVRARVNTSQTLLNPIVEILLALGIPPPGSGPGLLPLPGLPDPPPLPELPELPDPIPTPTVPTVPTPPPPPPPSPDRDCLPLLDPRCPR
jgi:phospholipid/cholesterol/gamma-HCH transport system substrate-binding protein